MERRFRNQLDGPKSQASLDARMLRAMLPFLREHRGRIGVSLALLIAAKVATVVVPLVLKRIVDTLDTDGVEVIVVPAALLVAYGAMRFVGLLFRELQQSVFGLARTGIMRSMSVQVVRHLHALSLRFHLQRRTGSIATDIGRGTNSVSNLLQYLLFNIVPTLVEVTMVASVLIAGYSAAFGVVCLVTFAIYVALTFWLTQWRTRFRSEMNTSESKATSDAIDGLLNFETVKYFGNEAYEVERYDRSLRRWEVAARHTQDSLSLLNAVQGLVISAGVTVTMFLAAQSVVDGHMTLGDLVAVNAYLIQIFIPLGFLGTVYSIVKQALADMERMFGLLDEVPDVQDAAHARPLELRAGAVRLESVDFGYGADRQILHGVTVDVPAGATVALVGPSGSGKSTIARLLFRFWDVDGGRVLVDGQDVRDVTQQSLRDTIGVVPQDTVLFNETLRFNLRYARLDATDAEIEQAVESAQLADFVARLPQGLETMVGERGLKLSGGEKQRVAIARALLKNPRILVFDEATSSLDSVSEAAILDAMQRASAERTAVVIAHRLSTIAHADRIYVLEYGRVVECGTHAELLARDGAYANLWRTQQREA
jgi:ABC-type transport system involved in Fe-S cluster assembly fused permease/ATPase subunit